MSYWKTLVLASADGYNLPRVKYYDFIIVGAGAAGCILARRLSDNPNVKVLVLEIGGNPPPHTEIPVYTVFDSFYTKKILNDAGIDCGAVVLGKTISSREVPIDRRINSRGLLLIREFEGFNPYIIEDPYTGRRIIGYGHNCNTTWKKCTNLRPPITGHQANILLRGDLQPFENCITKYTSNQNLTNDQFSALVSFAFSSGKSCEKIATSRLIKAANTGDFPEVAKYFEKLVSFEVTIQKRRKAERALFCMGDDTDVATQVETIC